MKVSVARRLKVLKSENDQLKKMLAEQMMDVATLKEMLEKTSEARFREDCRELGHEDQRFQSAPRFSVGRD